MVLKATEGANLFGELSRWGEKGTGRLLNSAKKKFQVKDLQERSATFRRVKRSSGRSKLRSLRNESMDLKRAPNHEDPVDRGHVLKRSELASCRDTVIRKQSWDGEKLIA